MRMKGIEVVTVKDIIMRVRPKETMMLNIQATITLEF